MSVGAEGSTGLRVLQVVLSLNAGGTERLVLELVKRLHPQIAMAVCCLDEKGLWAPELERRGLSVEAFGRQQGFTPRLGRAVARSARAHRAHVIHCHHYSPFVYGALSQLWRPSSRIVFTEHGRLSDAAPGFKRRLANRLFARVPSRVFAVSEDLRQHLVQEGFPPGLVKVIYNGIDVGDEPDGTRRVEQRRHLGLADEGTLVLCTIARLDPVKDLGTFVAAIDGLRRRYPIKGFIVGDGPARDALVSQIRALGLEREVTLLGERTDAREWLGACDVYVNTSVSEGVSLTILEAMAAARPVVATRVGGTPEVVTEQCGILVPARDPDAVMRAIEILAGNPALRRQMGAAGRARVHTRFSLNRMVTEYRDVYASLGAVRV